jgi:hypothetical protein
MPKAVISKAAEARAAIIAILDSTMKNFCHMPWFIWALTQ